MDMFDELKSDYPLPDAGEMQAAGFQTKDLEGMLTYYFINKDDRLLERVGRHTSEQQLAEMKNIETHANAVTPDAIYRPLNHTGEVSFYAFRGAPNEHGYEWVKYAAEFPCYRFLPSQNYRLKRSRQRRLS